MAAAMNVFQFVTILLTAFTYDASCQDRVGCFVDHWDRVLPSFRRHSSMTVEWCLNSCFTDSFVFAGLSVGKECWCGNSTDHTKHGDKSNDDECSTQCRGNRSQTCGGGWRLEIYQDHNECLEENNGGCNHNCVNSLGSYHCTCNTGYELMVGENMTCLDIDECSLGTVICSHDCINTAGGYNCSCKPGYYLDGDKIYTCTDIDECSLATSQCNQDCSNTDGGYYCSCLSGFYMAEDELYTCKDIDECTSGSHRCNQTCKNTPGAYECICDDGYKRVGNSSHECTDIDECSEGSHPCNQICINTPGRYKCDCKAGYNFKDSNMHTCSGDKASVNLEWNTREGKIISGLIAGLVIACLAIICLVLLLIFRFRRQGTTSMQTSSPSDHHCTGISCYENVTDNKPPEELPNYEELCEFHPAESTYQTINPSDLL